MDSLKFAVTKRLETYLLGFFVWVRFFAVRSKTKELVLERMFCLKAANAEMGDVETFGLRLTDCIASEREGFSVRPGS